MPKITDPSLLQQLGTPGHSRGMLVPDPFKSHAENRADASLGISAGSLAVSQANSDREAQRQAVLLPADARKATADATKAEVEAEKARRELAVQQSTASPQQQKMMAVLANDEIIDAITKARADVQHGYSAGAWARLPMKTQAVVDLEGSLNTISSRLTLDKLAQLKALSPTGASGLGSLTERESELLRDSVAALGQGQSPERLLENIAAVEKHYRNLKALSAGEDYRDPKVAERYGIARMPDPEAAKTLATGDMRAETDPAMRGVNGQIRAMIGANRPAAEIVGYMNSVRPGLGDAMAGKVAAAARFRAQNPTVPLDRYPIEVESHQVPMSGTRQFMNNAAQGGVGAYFAKAADAVTAGTIDNMAPEPAIARAGMNAVAAENPFPAFLGTLTGGALAGAGAEAAGAGLTTARLAPTVADLLYGAAYGAGSADDGNRFAGAAEGALSGVVGGQIGRRGMAAIGATLRGVQNEAPQLLRDRGVPLTVGQMLGGARKAKEDRLAGFGGIGDMIRDRRLEGIRGFNRAAFDEGLVPVLPQGVGQIGEEGIDTARQAVSGPNGAYSQALNGVTLTPDQPFTNTVAAALAQGSTLPRVGPEFGAFVDRSIAPHFSAPNGQIDGRQVQDILQQVRGADFGTDSMGNLASGAARDIEGAVMDLADRQVPGSMEALGNANTAYRNLNILADAVGRGINNDGLFMPSQLGAAARSNTTRFGGRIAAATPDRPFFELQRAGQEVLPSRVADSGTAGRMEANGGLTATLRSAARNALNAPLYAESTQNLIARLLMDRTPAMIRAGELAGSDRATDVAGLLARPAVLNYGPLEAAGGY